MPPGIGYPMSSRFRKLIASRTQPNPREQISARFNEQANRDERAGRQAEDLAGQRLRDFDAQEGAETSARAQFETFREDLGRDVEGLRGSQVGRGRLTTGFGFEDEDRLVGDSLKNLMRQLALNAQTAQGQNLQAAGQLGEMGANQSGRFLEILGSERDASFLEEEMRRRKKADSRGGFLSALGTIAKGAGGFIAGGPVGAAAALATG